MHLASRPTYCLWPLLAEPMPPEELLAFACSERLPKKILTTIIVYTVYRNLASGLGAEPVDVLAAAADDLFTNSCSSILKV